MDVYLFISMWQHQEIRWRVKSENESRSQNSFFILLSFFFLSYHTNFHPMLFYILTISLVKMVAVLDFYECFTFI